MDKDLKQDDKSNIQSNNNKFYILQILQS